MCFCPISEIKQEKFHMFCLVIFMHWLTQLKFFLTKPVNSLTHPPMHYPPTMHQYNLPFSSHFCLFYAGYRPSNSCINRELFLFSVHFQMLKYALTRHTKTAVGSTKKLKRQPRMMTRTPSVKAETILRRG